MGSRAAQTAHATGHLRSVRDDLRANGRNGEHPPCAVVNQLLDVSQKNFPAHLSFALSKKSQTCRPALGWRREIPTPARRVPDLSPQSDCRSNQKVAMRVTRLFASRCLRATQSKRPHFHLQP